MIQTITQDQTGAARSAQLWAELERIRGILVQEPEICQVLVFGSVATGAVHAWSDLDLVIIANTDLSFLKPGMWLSRLLNPRLGIQFLVYTPAEINELVQRPFIRMEILSKGKVLPMNLREEGLRWLAFAGEDMEVAKLALQAGIFNQTSFVSSI
jgi:predicted nucleotidyltransferase